MEHLVTSVELRLESSKLNTQALMGDVHVLPVAMLFRNSCTRSLSQLLAPFLIFIFTF